MTMSPTVCRKRLGSEIFQTTSLSTTRFFLSPVKNSDGRGLYTMSRFSKRSRDSTGHLKWSPGSTAFHMGLPKRVTIAVSVSGTTKKLFQSRTTPKPIPPTLNQEALDSELIIPPADLRSTLRARSVFAVRLKPN